METRLQEQKKLIDDVVKTAMAKMGGHYEQLLKAMEEKYENQVSDLRTRMSGMGPLTSKTGKIEFPKSNGEELKDWLYKCNQYFRIDGIPDEHKAHLASINLEGKAMKWHQSFLEIKGEQVLSNWEEYVKGLKATFVVEGDEGKEGEVFEEAIKELPDDSNPYMSVHALFRGSSGAYRTMRVTGYVNKKPIHILIDSGSTYNFLDVNVAKRVGCKLQAVEALTVDVTDGSSLECVHMCQDFTWWLQEPKGLPSHRPHDHKICLKEGTDPINQRPYRYPGVQKDVIEKMTQELLQSGIIQHSVFKLLRDNELFAKQSKCFFNCDRIEYLGHYISKGGVFTDPKKILAVQQWPQPKTVKELRGFLGLTGYYRRFSKEFVMETDASNVGIGAVLLQQGHLIDFINKALSLRHQISKILPGIYEEVRLSWKVDPVLREICNKLQQGSLKDSAYTWFEGQLKRKGRLVVGNNAVFRRKLIHLVHDNALGGHYGIQASTKRLMLLFYWKGLEKDVRQYIRQCDVCQHYKPENIPTPRLLQPLPIPKAIWTQVSMDFITGLPKSYGKDVIFVFVDRLTKYAHFIALQHHYLALIVAQAYMDNVFKLHGLPQAIVSDKDPICLSNFWQELSTLQGVELQCSSAYHPQTDGQTEVVNRCLENYLRCMTGDHPTEYNKWLLLAKWWYNTNFHIATQISPFKALYGLLPPLHITYVPRDSDVAIVDQSLQARDNMLKVTTQFPIDLPLPMMLEPIPVKRGNRAATKVLVQWSHAYLEDATWEYLYDIQQQFPNFHP
ncbi:hypothetical protein SLEP1_g33810 [Rubroshorea leprosula]|uniref:Integrase catalytic domain-containing protein n=1 Tax=Rubroshorea leprosula TaxID=152421 RepID=A0AAV5KHW8_9ROSI|nr:hypothetical protein SLEP1_g33810 [Rubroshorea leprosula]